VQSDGAPEQSTPAEQPGFGSRGRARRRARFLRRARELAYRDLGGLVFNLHRFGQRNDALVLAKLGTLTRIDSELRAIEDVLRERRPLTVLREAGITACPRCAAIHGSEDRFCPNCGFSVARNVDLPIAGAAAVAQPEPPAGMPVAPAAPAPAPSAPATAATPPSTATHAATQPPSAAQATPAPTPTAAQATPAPTPPAAEAPPAPPPTTAQATPTPTPPATQATPTPDESGPTGAPAAPPASDGAAAPGSSSGRSPVPPTAGGEPAEAGETTEILRPQAGGS
jgi:hypothetical protein